MTMDQDSPGKSDPLQTRFIKAGPCIKKGNFVFNIMYGKFWLDASSLFDIPLFRDDFLGRNEMLASLRVKGLKPV